MSRRWIIAIIDGEVSIHKMLDIRLDANTDKVLFAAEKPVPGLFVAELEAIKAILRQPPESE